MSSGRETKGGKILGAKGVSWGLPAVATMVTVNRAPKKNYRTGGKIPGAKLLTFQRSWLYLVTGVTAYRASRRSSHKNMPRRMRDANKTLNIVWSARRRKILSRNNSVNLVTGLVRVKDVTRSCWNYTHCKSVMWRTTWCLRLSRDESCYAVD